MIVNYERTIEDLVEFRLFHVTHSPSFRRLMLFGRIATSLLIIIVGLGIFSLFNGALALWNYVFALLFGVIVFVLLPTRLRARLKQNTRKMLAEGDNRAVLGPQSLTASPEGLLLESRAGESKFRWSSIVKIAQNDDYIFLYIGAANALVIPKKAFSPPEIQQEFLDFVRAHCERLTETS